MKKRITPIIIVLVIGIALMSSPFRSGLSSLVNTSLFPVKVAMSNAGKKVASTFSFVSSISSLRRENQQLTDKILSLEVDRSKIAELQYENSLLKREIGFMQDETEETLVPAKIIGREPTAFLDHFTIDKGSDDGIKLNAAVVSGGALVGQIREVYPNQSKVVLVTSKDSIILAMLQNSRAKGILRGGISGLILEDITTDVTYQNGENVITSGLDGEMPAGLLIGTVNKIESSSTSIFKNFSVDTVVDLSRLELVFVIK